MIICKTYEEAKLEAISLIVKFDNFPHAIIIYYDEKEDAWVVNMEEFEYDTIVELEEKGRL
jgi:hypothetical protein